MRDVPRAQQRVAFEKASLAEELGLPVIVHERRGSRRRHGHPARPSAGDGRVPLLLRLAEMALWLVERGWYIGFTGVVTFKTPAAPSRPCRPCRLTASRSRRTARIWLRSRTAAAVTTAAMCRSLRCKIAAPARPDPGGGGRADRCQRAAAVPSRTERRRAHASRPDHRRQPGHRRNRRARLTAAGYAVSFFYEKRRRRPVSAETSAEAVRCDVADAQAVRDAVSRLPERTCSWNNAGICHSAFSRRSRRHSGTGCSP